MFDGKAFGAEIASMVREHVARAVEPLNARIAELEAREIPQMPEIVLPEIPVLPDFDKMLAPVFEASTDVLRRVETLEARPGPAKGDAGKDADPDVIKAMVEEAVAAIPRAREGAPGKDGTGLAGALIDRAGHLVVTLTNGETKQLGLVVGKDGAPKDGADGRDGFHLEDFSAEFDGERTVTLKFSRGDVVKTAELKMPVVLDRGVYNPKAYDAGDAVTWAGSLWIAQRATEATDKPGDGDAFRLAVKKGRDGRDVAK